MNSSSEWCPKKFHGRPSAGARLELDRCRTMSTGTHTVAPLAGSITANSSHTHSRVRPVPRKKGSQEHIDAAWIEAKSEGFDITRLLTGGNPFKAA